MVLHADSGFGKGMINSLGSIKWETSGEFDSKRIDYQYGVVVICNNKLLYARDDRGTNPTFYTNPIINQFSEFREILEGFGIKIS